MKKIMMNLKTGHQRRAWFLPW